jgi:hypothetical protein
METQRKRERKVELKMQKTVKLLSILEKARGGEKIPSFTPLIFSREELDMPLQSFL